MMNLFRLRAVNFASLVLALPLIFGVASNVPGAPMKKASSAGTLTTAPANPTHPLDPLTAKEFASLKAILKHEPQLGEKVLFGWAQLREPPKEEVLAFQAGQKFRREATVVAISLD